jgi:hypothetical protein
MASKSKIGNRNLVCKFYIRPKKEKYLFPVTSDFEIESAGRNYCLVFQTFLFNQTCVSNKKNLKDKVVLQCIWWWKKMREHNESHFTEFWSKLFTHSDTDCSKFERGSI